jgi:hypothetical protein
VAWVREQPRAAAAAALVAVTALSGVIAPAATTSARAAGETPGLSRSVDPEEAGTAAAFYPLAAMPRPADGPIPLGKGMWVYQLDRAAGGNPLALVDQAKTAGLSHIYVRLGSSKKGFYAGRDLDRLLPVAHHAGIKVIGWDFPYLDNTQADSLRARDEIWYTTPTGHRIDGFSADIETRSEGIRLTALAVREYGALLRNLVGPKYPLVATVPRPSPKRWFPYNELGAFDAIAPMVYWGNRDPAADVAGAIAALAPYGKPVLPVGQAYDMAIDGGPAGSPSKQALERFITSASSHGALGVSFWVWDTATHDHWSAIREAKQLDLDNAAYRQRVVTGLHLPVTGTPDAAAVRDLLTPSS